VNVLEELKSAINTLNKVDEYKDSLVDKLSEQDKRLSDLEHYIEENKLSTNQCYRMIKEIKKQREIRRKIKNDYTILTNYENNINKLINHDNRRLLLEKAYKVNKSLDTKYKNRIYTEEEINEILGV
jgi:hypothetical protein